MRAEQGSGQGGVPETAGGKTFADAAIATRDSREV
jgi:hypothetical protein